MAGTCRLVNDIQEPDHKFNNSPKTPKDSMIMSQNDQNHQKNKHDSRVADNQNIMMGSVQKMFTFVQSDLKRIETSRFCNQPNTAYLGNEKSASNISDSENIYSPNSQNVDFCLQNQRNILVTSPLGQMMKILGFKIGANSSSNQNGIIHNPSSQIRDG